MYDILITKIGVLPMTRRSDIIKFSLLQPSSEPCSTISRITVYHGRNDRPGETMTARNDLMCPRKEHTIRIILRTVIIIFFTGYFYIFGKSNEGYAAETKSPPIRQELVHEYAKKQIPLARAAHAATYACHEVTSDCDFSRDLRNTEGCRKAERIVKHLGVIVRKELAKIKPPVTMDERNAIVAESIALAPSPIIKHGAPGEKDTCVTEWKD